VPADDTVGAAADTGDWNGSPAPQPGM
jgi:hypothetical protein